VIAGTLNHLQAKMVLEFRDEITLSTQGAGRRSSSPHGEGASQPCSTRRRLRGGLMSPTIYDLPGPPAPQSLKRGPYFMIAFSDTAVLMADAPGVGTSVRAGQLCPQV